MSTNKKYEIHPKSDDHGKWYQTVLTMSDMIDYSDVSGCYVLKPLANDIWENIKQYLDDRIKDMGVENCYFPLFVTKSNLEKESSHFEDFTPEVAWIVTEDPVIEQRAKKDQEMVDLLNRLKEKGLDVHVRTKSAERYAIRPTSETIIYPHFASWIKKSGRCPKINQWANVVRWENKQTTPFIRSREFLWQEGHTCHPDKTTALTEVYDVLALYKALYEDVLAVPMIPGIKTKSETFPGAELTATIEGFLPDSGRGIQSATSHYLGEKFAQMFNIKNTDGKYVHQNSWGLTTRSIGIMVMTHSDDRGLSLPPRVAPIQVVLVACGLNSKTTHDDKEKVNAILSRLANNLNTNGIRCVFDSDPNETPGMKFNKWESKGVPLRIEFGPKDVINNQIVFIRRDQPPKTKDVCKFDAVDHVFVQKYLDLIHDQMLERATQKVRDNLVYCESDPDIVSALQKQKLVLIPWQDSDDDGKLEQRLKELCKSNNINSTKILCIPDSDTLERFGLEKHKQLALFGRSY